MDTGHSWDPEKKASGTEDMPPIMVTSGIFVHHQWWKILRIQDPVFQEYARWTVEHSRRKIIETQATSMVSIATLTCSTRHFVPQTSSVSAEQSESGVEHILERQVKANSKVLARHPEEINSNRRISSHWLIFQDYRMLRVTECFRFWSPYNGEIIPSDRERKLLCYDYSWRWQMAKAQVNVQRIHSAQKPRGFKKKGPYASIGAERNWSSLKYWDCYSFDVPGIDVQVPSLDSPGYSVWIW